MPIQILIEPRNGYGTPRCRKRIDRNATSVRLRNSMQHFG